MYLDLSEIDPAQDKPAWLSLEFGAVELAGRASFDSISQPFELLFALIKLRAKRTFELIQGVSAHGARNFGCAIDHRKQDNHTILVEPNEGSSEECQCRLHLVCNGVTLLKSPQAIFSKTEMRLMRYHDVRSKRAAWVGMVLAP